MTGDWLLRPYHLPLRRGVAGARGTTAALVGTAVGFARDGHTAWACAPRLAAWPAWQPTIDAFARDLAQCVWQSERQGVGLASWLAQQFGLSVRDDVQLALTADLGALLDGTLARRVRATRAAAVKVKVGAELDLALLADAIARLRARCGPVSVRLDANGAWAHLPPGALRQRLALLRDAGADAVEDPAGWAEWPDAPPLPLALDLLDCDAATLRQLARQGCLSLAVVKPALCGSVAGFLELAANLHAARVPIAVSSCFDAPLGLRQLAALAAVAPGVLLPSGLATQLDLPARWRPPDLSVRSGRWMRAVVDVTSPPAPPPWRDLLAQAAGRMPRGRAVSWFAGGRWRGWSWLQLDRHASRIARGLGRAGLAHGAVLALWCDNGPELAAVLWGIWRAGLVAAPAHPRWTAPEFARWQSQVGARVCIVDGDRAWPDAIPLAHGFRGEFAATTGTNSRLGRQPLVPEIGNLPIAGPAASTQRAPPTARTQLHLAPTSPAVCALVATSGTTGVPKVVTLGERQLAAAAFTFWQRFPAQADDRWLLPLPMCHVAGLVALWRCAAAGVEAVLAPTADTAGIAAGLQRRGCTLASLVPTQLHRAVNAGIAPGKLRLVIAGGASAAPDLISAARNAHWPVVPSYGMTETAAALAIGDLGELPAQDGPFVLVGRPLPGVALAIAADDEILVRGDAVADSSGHWFATGDTGRLDVQGRLWVASRRADRLVRGGENVDPLEVEAALRPVAGVEDVAVVGIADAELGECVAAWIVTSAHAGSLEWPLGQAVAALSPFKRPQRWRLTAEPLPRNAMGKLDVAAVRRALAQTAAPKS